MEERIKKEEAQKGYFEALRTRLAARREVSGTVFGGERLLTGLGWGTVAFFLGICRLPFSIYPLGIAFLCASDTYLGFALAGLAVASFFLPLPPWVMLSVLVLTLLVRALTRLFVDIPIRSHDVRGLRGILEHIHGRLFCESVYLRMTCACVSVFALSLYAIVSGGFRYYDLFGAFFGMAVAPTATFFYSALFADLPVRSAWLGHLRRVAKCLLAFSLCLSLGGVEVSGVSFGMASAVAATLILCRRDGLLSGLLTALLCALSLDPSHFVILPVVAVVSYCLFDFSPYMSAFVSCIVGGITGVLTVGRETLLVLFLPLVLGTSVYFAFEKLFVQNSAIGLRTSAAKEELGDLHRLEAYNGAICSEVEGISHSLYALAERMELLGGTRSSEGIRAFAEGYRATAEIFAELPERVEARYREDEKKTVAVRDKLREIGFCADRVRVCGDEDVRIFISGLTPIPDQKRLTYLQKQLGRTLDCMLSVPRLTSDGGQCHLYAERAICFEAECGIAQVAKEEDSGDAVCYFKDEGNKQFYVLINDGMGSGREAAITAAIGADFLARLLGKGVEVEKALRMLNSFLSHGRNGGEVESYTTVDLFRLDLLTGHATFLKSGAVPSYVKRGTNIFKLNGAGLPVGILAAVDTKQVGLDLRDGDVIVQVSDGVTGEEEECLWLLNYLNSTEEGDPLAMAEHIKMEAVANGSRDDISVAVTKIHRKI